MVLSSRRSSEAAYEKVVLSPRNIKNRMMYQAEQFTKTQVFHRNMDSAEALIFVVSLLRSDFKQLNSFSDEIEYNLKISKKGKIMLGKHLLKREDMANTEKRSDIPVRAGIQYRGSALSHNRRKRRLIEEGSVVEPLIDMGIFTKDGKIVRSMEDKFRQINRFLEIVDDAVETCGFEENSCGGFRMRKSVSDVYPVLLSYLCEKDQSVYDRAGSQGRCDQKVQ